MENTQNAVAAATPAVEPKTQAPEAEAPKTEELSPKFAALARKERALVQREQQLKAEREAIERERGDYKTKFIDREAFKKNPLRVLQEEGFTYEQLAEMVLNTPNEPDPYVKQLEERLNKFEESASQREAREKEEREKAYQNAVNQIRTQVKVLIDGSEEFETIRETDSVEAVVALIEDTYEAENRIMPAEEAAKLVEEYLLEESLRLAKIKKVRDRLSAAEPKEETAPKEQTPQANQPKTINTLTNESTTTLSKPLSRKERRERALLAGMGKLER